MKAYLFESPAKLSVPCKTGKELELQVSIASMFLYGNALIAQLVEQFTCNE